MAENGMTVAREGGELPDSDCEIAGPEIETIEIIETPEENAKPVLEEPDAPMVEVKEESLDNHLLTIAFSQKLSKHTKFRNIRDSLKEAIQSCFKKSNINVEISEDSAKNFTVQEVEAEEEVIFLVDTTPANSSRGSATIPSYKRSIQKILNDEKPDEKIENTDSKKAGPSCFNCSGSHALKDCPKPRNQQKINKARKQFKGKGERYHVDIEQRFAHIKPGEISNDLRQALGLRNRNLPEFIYKMRLLGYPPGWLEAAKVAHSGINLFDSEGRQVHGSDEEEGEVEAEKDKYDIEKIISFPGFNVAPPKNFIDEFKYFGVPPMLPEHSKENFVSSLRGSIATAYKRKKLKNLEATPIEAVVQPVVDMEIEEEPVIIPTVYQPLYLTNPPLPPEHSVKTPPPPPPPESPGEIPLPPGTEPDPLKSNSKKIDEDVTSSGPDEFGSRASPSLEDLEARQKRLLDALMNASTTESQDDSLVDEIIDLEAELAESNGAQSQDRSSISSRSRPPSAMASLTEKSTPGTPTANTSDANSRTKLIALGTPLLKFSPYEKLPTDDQFSKGVSDVINFENLPDSTGKYEQMKLVLKKVRKKLTEIE